MEIKRFARIAGAIKYGFLSFCGVTLLGSNCFSQTVPASSITTLTPNPTSLTFANANSPAQQLTISGVAPQYTNSGNPGSQCFNIAGQTTQGTSVTYSISPTGALGACELDAYAAGTSQLLVPIAIGVQALPNSSITYTAGSFFVGSGATLQSSNAQIASVPAAVNSTSNSSLGMDVVTFTITTGHIGSAVIHLTESNNALTLTYAIPVLVSTGPAPTPTPSPTATPTSAPTTAPTSAPTTAPNTFTLLNSSSQTFSLVGSPVAAQVSFFGTVTISGASSENVGYSEITGVPANGCPVTGTVVDAISLTFPTSFSFAPNGSFGPGSGLLDTLFSPASATGTYYGTIYQAGTCATPFDSAAAISSPPSSYEYPGGGNTNVPAGTYILELWH